MKIPETVQNGAAILTLSGKLMGGPETEEFDRRIHELSAAGVKRVVLDMSGVEWINSRGLAMIIAAYNVLTKEGGGVKLARIGDNVLNLFMVTKLITVFDTYDTVEEAAASYAK